MTALAIAPELVDLVKAFLILVGVFVTGWASVRVARIGDNTNKQAQTEASTLTWAQQMSTRLENVEGRVRELEEKLGIADRVITALGGYVDALLWWVKTGQTSPMPRPPVIVQGHLDPNLIELDPPTAHDGPPSVRP